jgi:hypothetical protein
MIQYAVAITTAEPQTLQNMVELRLPDVATPITATTKVAVNMLRIYLPLIFKDVS